MVETRPGSRAFEALAHPYRRQLLLGIFEAKPQDDDGFDPVDLLAEGEPTSDPAATRIRLSHWHLPKLADMGFIDWDRETGDLSKGPNWSEITPLLQLLHDNRRELPDDLVSGLSADT